ncbi:helix-turn-helix domain-containing protein [Streptomyces sp. BH055]|uniref:helix-turn-helix domain-containing protein n=1 Tax=Streptomyces sp. BH055 TaxID=3401173 RepID=UPI003BB6DD5B
MTPHGSAIRFRRQALKLSLRDLSQATGLNPGHLSRVERGLGGLRDDKLRLVADALGVPCSDISVETPAGDNVNTPTAKGPRIRTEIPAPNAPEGELFHYSPDEAALYLPFTARKLRELAYGRRVDHVNNGNRIWFSGRNIRSISEQFMRPALKSA